MGVQPTWTCICDKHRAYYTEGTECPACCAEAERDEARERLKRANDGCCDQCGTDDYEDMVCDKCLKKEWERAERAEAEVERLNMENDRFKNAHVFLMVLGYRLCDIPACNCDSYHDARESDAPR
jgi:hypothetical protein